MNIFTSLDVVDWFLLYFIFSSISTILIARLLFSNCERDEDE